MVEIAVVDPSGVFNANIAKFTEHLSKFRNVHWQPPSTNFDLPTLTIPSLNVHLVQGTPPKHKQHQIIGLHPPPLVQIFCVETVANDVFKKSIREVARQWFRENVQTREQVGYVLVHVVNNIDKSRNRHQFGKLANEFGSAHCIQLDLTSNDDFKALHMLVQMELVSAFTRRIETLQTEINKLEATREMPGWNFGALFVANESLACALEGMNLMDSALEVYKELELKIPELDTPKAPPHSLLSLKMGLKSPRDLLVEPMLTNKLVFFDFKRHVLAQQVKLYFALASGKHQPPESNVGSVADLYVLKAVQLSLQNVPVLMSSLEKHVGKVHANIFLLKEMKQLFQMTFEYGSSKLSLGKGDILLLQRDALQVLGASFNWHIKGIFNELSLNCEEDMLGIDLSEFMELQDETMFLQEFIRLTKTALDYFRVANMKRVVNKLSIQLAMVYYSSNQHSLAWELFQRSPMLRQPDKELLGHQVPVLNAAMDCALTLNKETKVLECCWRLLSMDLNKVPTNLTKKALKMIVEYEHLSPTTHDLGRWFAPRLLPYLNADSEGYFLEVELNKKFKTDFLSFTSASIVGMCRPILGPEVAVSFECKELNDNLIKLYTNKFVEGTLKIKSLNMEFKSQMFTFEFVNLMPIAMKPLTSSLNTSVRLSNQYTMQKRNILLSVNSPTVVDHASVHVQATDPSAQVQAPSTLSLNEFTTEVLEIPVLVDYSKPKLVLKVNIKLKNGFTYECFEHIDFSLPVSVDFQEYYREPPQILLQFLVRPFLLAPIVFSKAELTGSSNYDVDSEFGLDLRNRPLTAYVNAPISYIFKLKKNNTVNNNNKMQLKLTYRSLVWEIRQLIQEELLKVLNKLNLEKYKRQINNVAQILSTSSDLQTYFTTQKVCLSFTKLKTAVVEEFNGMNQQDMDGILDLMEPICKNGMHSNSNLNELNSEITLDVPDPDASCVHYVKLKTKPLKYLTVGEVLNVTLEIDTIQIQGSEEGEFEYMFDRLSDGWSYTGKVTGTFKGTGKVKESLSLIPHRSGELRLPNVVIRPKSKVSEPIVVSSHANTEILVVPDVNMLAITF